MTDENEEIGERELQAYLSHPWNQEGGPAFPAAFGAVHYKGMSLRDWFAGQALGHMISASINAPGGWSPDTVASGAYLIADAMLKAREK